MKFTKGIDERTPTLSVRNVLITYPDFPKKEAYRIVKTLYDHSPEWTNAHQETIEIGWEEAMGRIPIDFHPGANQFMKEIID